jgi:antitoxin component of RelBE/YafQ-DinJ toxin-antitoxin module
MKHKALRVTDGQDMAIGRMAAKMGVSESDVLRMALDKLATELDVVFPLDNPSQGHGARKYAQSIKGKSLKGKKKS